MTLFLILFACLPEFPNKQGTYPENPTHDFDQDEFTEEDRDCNDQDSIVYPASTNGFVTLVCHSFEQIVLSVTASVISSSE